VIGHWIVSYESSDSQLEGPEGVELIEPQVESEKLGLLWSVSEIEDFINMSRVKPGYSNTPLSHSLGPKTHQNMFGPGIVSPDL